MKRWIARSGREASLDEDFRFAQCQSELFLRTSIGGTNYRLEFLTPNAARVFVR